MKVVILCGGSGTRLWPVSRTLFPKQFVKLFDNYSLFQKTLQRNIPQAHRFSIVINKDQYSLGQEQFKEIQSSLPLQYILEPVGRNTAPAITLAALASKEDEVLLVVPSDHLIEDQKAYHEVLELAESLALQGNLVTFGIKPTYPETGYGYIEAEKLNVKSFKEKPDHKTALEYLKAGNYFWNSGMFCFKAGVFLEELKKYAPDIYESSVNAFRETTPGETLSIPENQMNLIRSESIDYAVMEKSNRVKVVPSDIGWTDLGSFDSLGDVLPKDQNNNTVALNTLHLDSKNNLVLNSNRLISTIGVENLIIVDTPDALLIANKGSSQKVKEVVTEVKKLNPQMTTHHQTVHRPWGSYTVLVEKEHYKVKQILVKPGARLSLQYHEHRSEHWVVIKGEATVTVGESISTLSPHQSADIPQKVLHRLENKGLSELIIIETQLGNYLGEDDIIRVDDDYKRV